MPGDTLLPKAGPIGAFIGLALGALMIVIISFSYSYLIGKYLVTGGSFIYTDTAFGKTHAFLCGWFIAIAYWALISMNTTAVAMGLVGSILVIASVILIGGVEWSNLQPYFAPEKTTLGSIFAVTALAPWAYVGFDCIPQASEEYAFSNKKTKVLLISSVSMAALMYMIMNIATAVVAPWQQYIVDNKAWPTGAAVESLIGTFGLILLAIAMLCGIISGLNAFYLSGSRLLYSMAIAEAIPKSFSKLDSKHHVPRTAIIFMMTLAIIAPFFGREVLGWLVDMTSVGAGMGFTYTCASALKIAKREGDKDQVIISAIGLAFAAFFMLLLVIPKSPGFLSLQAWGFLLVWFAIGAVFFFLNRKRYYASTALQEKISKVCAENREDC